MAIRDMSGNTLGDPSTGGETGKIAGFDTVPSGATVPTETTSTHTKTMRDSGSIVVTDNTPAGQFATSGPGIPPGCVRGPDGLLRNHRGAEVHTGTKSKEELKESHQQAQLAEQMEQRKLMTQGLPPGWFRQGTMVYNQNGELKEVCGLAVVKQGHGTPGAGGSPGRDGGFLDKNGRPI